MMTNATRVLVAEDEPSLARLFEYVLSKQGCAVEVVESGDRASARLTESEFDLVVLDQMMPGQTGQEVWRALRHYSQVPVLLMSARNLEPEFAAEFARDQRARFMRKPFDPQKFIRQVEALASANDEWAQIRAEFLATLPERLTSLEAANTFDQAKAVAHRLAGVAASYGFPELGEAAFSLEAKPDDFDKAPLMDALRKVIQKKS